MKPHFSSNDVQIIHQEQLYQGYLRVAKYSLRYRLFAGGWSSLVERELCLGHHAVGILLFNPYQDEIILTEQFRLGAHQANVDAWQLEIAAGIIEPNEKIIDVAKRETFEETGYDILDLVPICNYLSSAGMTNSKFSLFCGKINQTQNSGLFGLAHEQEDIRTHVFPKQQVYKFLNTGLLQNAATIIAVQWLQLNENILKRNWQ